MNESTIFQRTPRSVVAKVLMVAMVAAIAVTVSLATPSLGFLVNQTWGMGSFDGNINQQVQAAASPTSSEPWQIQLQAQGATDVYVNQLVVAPGGYSGWHTHPGILIGTVVSGSIDFYDANCQKKSYGAGHVFLENSDMHGIINTGAVNAELLITFLVQRNAPRRIEAAAPACAATTGIL